MDIKNSVFGYLIDIEEDTAAEIIRESEFRGVFEDVLFPMNGDFDEYYLYRYDILIKAKYYKDIETVYLKEKEIIEKALVAMTAPQNEHIRYISSHPLPRIYTEVSRYNQNDKMKQYLIDGDIDTFFRDVKAIFASLSNNIRINEAYFHSSMHVLLKVLGFDIVSEDETNLGRIDSVIELDNKIYIIEFKTSDSQIAIQQIKDKKYYEKYLIKNKEIVLIGVGCSIKEKNIESWQVETYMP